MNKTGVECPQCKQKTDASPCQNCGYVFGKQTHECGWDSIEWESGKDCKGFPFPLFQNAGMGETLERHGKCKVCGKTFREVYIQSLIIDEQTGKEQTIF